MSANPPDVTQVLMEFSAGDREAMDRLLPMVYDHLRRMAERQLRGERADHTLNATALVHEAYLKLVQLDRIDWRGRAHFFGAAAQSMRRILISYARMKKAERRGSGADHVSLDNVVVAAQERPADLLALDEALTRLEAMSERQARVVECRFFAGMGVDETAEVLGVSTATVKRDWTVARAFLTDTVTVARAIEREYDAVLEPFDLSFQRYQVLASLRAAGPRGLSSTAFLRNLRHHGADLECEGDLERHGLIERDRSGARTLTSVGRRRLAELDGLLEDVDDRITQRVGLDELEGLTLTLAKLDLFEEDRE
jgi:RNA polymerase sigma-70 factor (ECF subfamily)